MNDDEKYVEKDPELSSWLRSWRLPPAPARLDERVKASYRAVFLRAPAWKRLWEARINVSLPLAVLSVGLVLGTGILAGNLLLRGSPGEGDGDRSHPARGGGLVNLRPLPEVRLTVVRQGGDPDEQR